MWEIHGTILQKWWFEHVWNMEHMFFFGGEIPEVYKCRIFPARLDYRRVIQIQLLLCALFWKKSIVQGDIRSTSSTHIIRKDYWNDWIYHMIITDNICVMHIDSEWKLYTTRSAKHKGTRQVAHRPHAACRSLGNSCPVCDAAHATCNVSKKMKQGWLFHTVPGPQACIYWLSWLLYACFAKLKRRPKRFHCGTSRLSGVLWNSKLSKHKSLRLHCQPAQYKPAEWVWNATAP